MTSDLILDQPLALKLAENVCSSLIYRLDNLTDNEIKEQLDKEILKSIIEVQRVYMGAIETRDAADQAAELREL